MSVPFVTLRLFERTGSSRLGTARVATSVPSISREDQYLPMGGINYCQVCHPIPVHIANHGIACNASHLCKGSSNDGFVAAVYPLRRCKPRPIRSREERELLVRRFLHGNVRHAITVDIVYAADPLPKRCQRVRTRVLQDCEHSAIGTEESPPGRERDLRQQCQPQRQRSRRRAQPAGSQYRPPVGQRSRAQGDNFVRFGRNSRQRTSSRRSVDSFRIFRTSLLV